MTMKTGVWLVLVLLSAGCATANRLLDNLTSPGTGEGGIVTPGDAVSGVEDALMADIAKYGQGGVGVGLLGMLGAILGERRKRRRQAGELYAKHNEQDQMIRSLQDRLLKAQAEGKV